MPTTTRIPLPDIALATSAVNTLVVSAGPGQVPTTPSTLTYNASTQTLSVGAVAAVPKLNTGTETGTLANPNPQTLFKHQTIDPARGRWDLLAYGDFFSNGSSQVWDPGLFIGYNPNRDFADPGLNSEPSFTYNLEAYYYEASTGKTTAEAYVEFLSPADDGVNRFQRRPWSFTLDRASGATRFGVELGPVVAGFASSYTIAAGPATGGSFSIMNVVAGASAAASLIQLLSPTVSIGTHTVSDVDGGSSGTLIFGNDNQPTRSLAGNNTTLEVGSWFTSLRYKTPAGVTVQADTIDEIDVFTFNANVLHTNHKIFQIQHVGSTLAYVDIAGLTAANLASSGTLTVAGGSTFSGLIDTDTSGADGAYNEVFRAQIAGNLGTGNWRNSIESSCSSVPASSGVRIKIATSQTTQAVVATFKGDLSTTLAGSLSVGGGASLSKILPASAILDFPSIAAGGQQELTISVTGAAVGAMVALGPPSGLEAGVVVAARVSASGVVTVRAANITGSPIDPASATYNVVVFNP
jgi:hypothetical protein